jgi:hypothetical protein
MSYSCLFMYGVVFTLEETPHNTGGTNGQNEISFTSITFTMLVPSAADTKKNGRLCFAANLNSFLVTCKHTTV